MAGEERKTGERDDRTRNLNRIEVEQMKVDDRRVKKR